MTLLSCILASICLAPIPADAGVKKTPPIMRVVIAECQSTTVRKSAIATSVFKIPNAEGYRPFAVDYYDATCNLRRTSLNNLILTPYVPGESAYFIVRIERGGIVEAIGSPLKAQDLCPGLSQLTKSQDKEPNRTGRYAYLLSVYLINPKDPKLPALIEENKGSDDTDLANLAKWIEAKLKAPK